MNITGGMKDIVPAQSKPLASVQTLLIWMMLALLVPGLTGGSFFMVRQYQDGRAQLATTTIQTARAMTQAVDAQLAQGETLALLLATSDSLMRRDFAAFHKRALRLIGDMPFVKSVLIYDRSGAPFLNSRLPFGQALPRRTDVKQIESVFDSARPAKPEVIQSPLTQMPVISIVVPIFLGNHVEYALAMEISPEVFSSILTKQNLPPHWVTGVVDDSGTIAARTHNAETFVGKKAVSGFLHQMAIALEGSIEATTLEGIQTIAPYSRSAQSGWSVVIGIPRSELEANLRQSMLRLGSVALLLLGLSLGLVWYFGARIAASVLALRALAHSVENGTHLLVPPVQVKEAKDVAESIATAALRLRERDLALRTAHETLVKREADLAEAQHIAKVGSWTWDKLANTIRASEEMRRIFGRTTIPPYEEQDGTLFAHDAWLELGVARMAMIQTGIGYNLDLPVLHASGTQVWVNMRAEVVRNPEGELIEVHGMVQDITERKLTETAMVLSEMRYRTLVEDSPEAIVVHRKGRILFANKACVEMIGAKSASEIRETSILDYVHPDFHQSTMARMQSISKLGELAPLVGLKFLKLDRSVMDGEAQSTAVLFDGAPAIQIYLRDITERKRQANELSALRTNMQSMMEWQVARHTVAALAHEINQPLASVSLLCEAASRMLAKDGLLQEPAGEWFGRLEQTLQRMASESERAGTVIRQLMKSVRQPDITLQPTRVNVLLDEASKIVLHDGAFDCQIHISCPGDLKPINTNPLQITKVLVNLLTNAAQAMQSVQMANGEIWMSAALEPDDSAVRVSVRDSGPGIDARTQREIFQAFVTTKPNGLGMGLVISRALVEAHGGKLWQEADTSSGAIFHFTLPTSR